MTRKEEEAIDFLKNFDIERYPYPEDYVIEFNKNLAIIIKSLEQKQNNRHWLDNADSWICPVCGFETNCPSKYEGCKCPQCGFQDEKDINSN